MGTRREERLLQSAIEGDEEALIPLLESHAPSLRRRMEPRIPQRHRSVVSIDDVMQQTFVDACRDIKRLDPQAEHTFTAWLEAIAERNLLDAVRMLDAKKRGGDLQRIANRTREDSCRDLIDLLSGDNSTPSQVAVGREAIEMLETAVRSLPAEYHTVVEMYDLQNRPIEDVSHQLDRSEGAVYMLRARAHRMLGEVLGGSARVLPESE